MAYSNYRSEGNVEIKAITAAKALARKIFFKRGNHSEIHLREDQLVIIIAVAYRLGERGTDLAPVLREPLDLKWKV